MPSSSCSEETCAQLAGWFFPLSSPDRQAVLGALRSALLPVIIPQNITAEFSCFEGNSNSAWDPKDTRAICHELWTCQSPAEQTKVHPSKLTWDAAFIQQTTFEQWQQPVTQAGSGVEQSISDAVPPAASLENSTLMLFLDSHPGAGTLFHADG